MDFYVFEGEGMVVFEAMFERTFTNDKAKLVFEYDSAYKAIEIDMRETDPEQGFNVGVPTTKQELLELRDFIDNFIQRLP